MIQSVFLIVEDGNMKREKIIEIVDDVIMNNPSMKKHESLVYEIVKVVLIHYENRLGGKYV